MSELLALEIETGTPPPVVSKAAFAEELGVAKSRISQLVSMGLPLTNNGKVPRAEALEWYRANIDPNRRKAMTTRQLETPKAKLDAIRAEREQLELDKARRGLVDRKAAEKAVFERARAERDAHLSWASRAAPILAAELDADPTATYAALDRLIRQHLEDLAKTPWEGLGNE